MKNIYKLMIIVNFKLFYCLKEDFLVRIVILSKENANKKPPYLIKYGGLCIVK